MNIGYKTPFIAILFSKQLTIILFIFTGTIGLVYFGKKIFIKYPTIANKLDKMWKDLWWNSPIKTFIELFIEIAFLFFLNSLNVSHLAIIYR